MKLFYQLSQAQQDAAIEHCADLVANNAIEHGLRIEATDEEDGKALKERIDSLLADLKERTNLRTREEKLQFLMEDDVFADTIMELASEMAHNAFYHESDELVVFTDSLDERAAAAREDDEDDDIDTIEDLIMKGDTKKYLN